MENNLDVRSDKALNGLQAVEKVRAKHSSICCSTMYKLIFMDGNMPVMDGLEASRLIMEFAKAHNY